MKPPSFVSRKNPAEKWLFSYPDERNVMIARLEKDNARMKEEIWLLETEVNKLVGMPLFKKWVAQEKAKKKKRKK